MPLGNGEVVDVAILGCIPGREGTAGDCRAISRQGSRLENLQEIQMQASMAPCIRRRPAIMRCRSRSNRKSPPKAQIIATIDDTGPQYFDIEIEHVSLNEAQKTKNMVIRVTDEDLLSVTGGIVQGMSGSPILPGWELVGAVTHVPQRAGKGYGIFAENMINELQELQKMSMNAG